MILWVLFGIFTVSLGSILVAECLKPRAIRKREEQRLLEEADKEPCPLTARILEAYEPYEKGQRAYQTAAQGGCWEGPSHYHQPLFEMMLTENNPYKPGTKAHTAWCNGFKNSRYGK